MAEEPPKPKERPTTHFTIKDLAENPNGKRFSNFNPDLYHGMICLVKDKLMQCSMDLNHLFGRLRPEHTNVTPEKILDDLAVYVLRAYGVIGPEGEDTNPDMSRDTVKRIILYCALCPDLLGSEEVLTAVGAVRTKEERQLRFTEYITSGRKTVTIKNKHE